jgi:uncharacterized protein YggE
MKNIILIIIITCLGNLLFGQLQNIPLITVTGESVMKVSPDYVIVGIRIKKKLLTNIERKPAFEIFKEEDTKIRLFDFNESDISRTIIQIDSSTYYKEVFITINDVKKLDKYLLELSNLGYNDYIYIDYRVTNYNRYKMQCRKDAVNAAKKKAQALVAELGQTLGKAHTIEDLDSQDYNWYNLKNKENAGNITFKLGADNYVIEPGYITITSKVKLSFDLQ